jgi:hypothetical protein
MKGRNPHLPELCHYAGRSGYLAIFSHNLIVLVRRIRELTSIAGRYSKTYLHHFIAFMAFYGLVDFLM